MTPSRMAPNVVDASVGSALGINPRSKKYGLYGTTWGKLSGETTSMSKRSFTITGEWGVNIIICICFLFTYLFTDLSSLLKFSLGNMPQLHEVDDDGIILSGKTARYRRLNTDEQLALMGFPPSMRALVVWREKNNSKVCKWIGSGVPLHIGIAVACSMLSFVTGRKNECAALIDLVNRDFLVNSRRPRPILQKKRKR